MTGCASRYRLDLFMVIDGRDKKVSVEHTEYIIDARFNDPFADNKIAAGEGAVVVLTTGTRGKMLKSAVSDLFGFDEYLTCRLYLQVANPPAPDSLDVVGNSFVYLLKRYDWAPEAKVFLPQSGYLVIDSVASASIFGTVSADYENNGGIPLSFKGRFKVKIAE
ncbi:MAG: hypothetical protein OEW00_14555 [candidate division Zixibacteria bacterium]|nr:hypothetical protein [candidate division Zixibacteria bacterium]